MMASFDHKEIDLFDAIDVLKASGVGAVDSVPYDPDIEDAVRYIDGLDDDAFRRICARYARERLLSDEAISAGHGVEDVVAFGEWIDSVVAG